MDLIYTNPNREDVGVLQDFELDLAFGSDENNFECKIPASAHCCEAGSLLYMEGTEYGGIVDSIESDTEAKEVTYKGRTWHGILGSKVIEPLKDGEASGGRLPKGYTELTYIESTGEQYIDTGINYDSTNFNTLRFVFKNLYPTLTSSYWLVNGCSGSGIFYVGCTNSSGQVYYGNGTNVNTGKTVVAGTVYEWDFDAVNGTLKLNGETIASEITFSAPSASLALSIFGYHTTASNVDKHPERIFNFMIYDNGNLIRDFIPCKNPDGEVGLYDAVTKAFFGNSGTGVFVPSVEPRNLPDDYTQVEYIQSSGTQYIDTGFKPNQDTRVVMDAQPINATSNGYHAIFGCRGDGVFYELYKAASSSTNLMFFYGSTYSQSFTIDWSARQIFEINKNVATVGGVSLSYAATTFQLSCNLYLGVDNEGGKANGFTPMCIYSCQVYDNGNLIRDFVPCKNASGEYGLYDLVNDVFYTNAGSGTFSAGSTVDTIDGFNSGGEGNDFNVTIKTEDAEGNSLISRYLVISGDANDCIGFILDRLGLSALFLPSEEAAGVNIKEYQFNRFTDGYSGMMKMLASAGLKLHTEVQNGQVVFFAEARVNYATDEEFDSDLVDFKAVKKFNAVNHLICLGSGELENRTVIHLYADKDGNISQTQTQEGLDEYVSVYDYSSAESKEELITSGTEKLKELWEPGKLSVDFDDTSDNYDVGDIVGAVDNITAIAVSAEITKKIVTIKNGLITISYKVGE